MIQNLIPLGLGSGVSKFISKSIGRGGLGSDDVTSIIILMVIVFALALLIRFLAKYIVDKLTPDTAEKKYGSLVGSILFYLTFVVAYLVVAS